MRTPTRTSLGSFGPRSFGLPIEGYKSAAASEQEQQRKVDRTIIRDGIARQVEALVDGKFAGEACSVLCSDEHKFRVFFDYGVSEAAGPHDNFKRTARSLGRPWHLSGW